MRPALDQRRRAPPRARRGARDWRTTGPSQSSPSAAQVGELAGLVLAASWWPGRGPPSAAGTGCPPTGRTARPAARSAGCPRWSAPVGLGANRPVAIATRSCHRAGDGRSWRDLWGIWHCCQRRGRAQDAGVATRDVVLVVFPGLQGLDLIGPAEVFAAANQEVGRPAYRIRVAATAPGPGRVEQRRRRSSPTRRSPTSRGPDRHADGGGRRRHLRRRGRRAPRQPRRPAGRRRPPRHERVLGRVRARPGRPPRRPARHHPLARVRPPRSQLPRRARRPRPDLRARRQRVDLGRRHRRHGPGPRPRRGRPRPRRRPRHRPPLRAVPPPARQPEPVQRAAPGAGRRSTTASAPRSTTSPSTRTPTARSPRSPASR